MDLITTTEKGLEQALIRLENGYKERGSQESEPNLWVTGCSTGFTDLDRITGGLKTGFIVVAGRTLHGADVLHCNLVESAMFELCCASDGNRKVLFFNTSLSSDDFYTHLLSSLSRVKFEAMMKGRLSDEDWARIAGAMDFIMKQQSLLMVNRPTLYIEDIEQICDETIEQYGALPVIAIDSLQAVRSRKAFDNRYAETAEITRTLKALSVKYNTRLVVRSNLNRNLELRADKRPVLFDLRDSGTIEDDATMVIFSYVESVYVPDECFDGVSIMEAIVAKNDGGQQGTATLLYSAPYSRADNYVENYRELVSADVIKFPFTEKEE